MHKFLLMLLLTAIAAAETPEAVLKRVFTFVERADMQIGKQLNQLEPDLTAELYTQLQAAYNKDPNSGEFLDFDPWSNSQMGFAGFRLGAAKMVGGQAKVPATIKVVRGGTSKYTCVLVPSGDTWKLANFVYSQEFNLLSYLRSLNGSK